MVDLGLLGFGYLSLEVLRCFTICLCSDVLCCVCCRDVSGWVRVADGPRSVLRLPRGVVPAGARPLLLPPLPREGQHGRAARHARLPLRRYRVAAVFVHIHMHTHAHSHTYMHTCTQMWSDLRTTELTYWPCTMRHTSLSKVWLGAGPRLKYLMTAWMTLGWVLGGPCLTASNSSLCTMFCLKNLSKSIS